MFAFLFAAALSFAAKAQTPAPSTTGWENETLKLRLFYPSDLVKGDTEQILHDGHLAFPGVSGATDPKLAGGTRCLRPELLLQLPRAAEAQTTASVLLAELDINCLNAEHESASTTLLNDMTEIVNKVPGMKPTAPPSTYTIGWQKVHMAAAQGQPPDAAPGQLYTMAISTNWNSHLLVWYFSSNDIATLNRITKTTVRFGRDQAAPLYPLTIGNASH
ncbi:MAG: hypothetical protein ABI286_09950 [Edaphobacter sp.]